jgi:7-cyano-7-deazaguanine tRNA-ribosyltransferase
MSALGFELKSRDGLARVCKLTTPHGDIETPTLLPVINPHDQLIPAQDMAKLFGAQGVITNSYIIYKSKTLKDEAVKHGVHKIIDYNGPVMTDSGTFQLYTYGKVVVEPKDIIEFQKQIKPDLGTILDVFGSTDRTLEEAQEDVSATLTRAKEAVEIADSLPLAGTIQGGKYPELRTKCAVELSKLPFAMHPIGGVVPFMGEYKFKDLVQIILACKKGLNPARPVHLFGAGHPMVFPLAVAMGCDTFDSASYVKYALDNRFMFPNGTKKLEQMDRLPCVCPVCNDTTVNELRGLADPDRVKTISLHNLYVCFNELEQIKQSIHEGTLLELVEQRAHAHPHLLYALQEFYQEWRYLEEFEPLSRKRLLYVGPESLARPDVKRFQERLRKHYNRPQTQTIVCFPEPGNREEPFEKHYETELAALRNITDTHVVFQTMFGPVPIEFDGVYPVGQSVIDPELAARLSETPEVRKQMEGYSHKLQNEFTIIWTGEETLENIKMLAPGKNKFDLDSTRVRAIADYQFGPGASEILCTGKLEFVKSKNTGKIRNVISDNEHILSLRAADGLFTLKP